MLPKSWPERHWGQIVVGKFHYLKHFGLVPVICACMCKVILSPPHFLVLALFTFINHGYSDQCWYSMEERCPLGKFSLLRWGKKEGKCEPRRKEMRLTENASGFSSWISARPFSPFGGLHASQRCAMHKRTWSDPRRHTTRLLFSMWERKEQWTSVSTTKAHLHRTEVIQWFPSEGCMCVCVYICMCMSAPVKC